MSSQTCTREYGFNVLNWLHTYYLLVIKGKPGELLVLRLRPFSSLPRQERENAESAPLSIPFSKPFIIAPVESTRPAVISRRGSRSEGGNERFSYRRGTCRPPNLASSLANEENCDVALRNARRLNDSCDRFSRVVLGLKLCTVVNRSRASK